MNTTPSNMNTTPKTSNRFIAELTIDGRIVIPSFCIYAVDIPEFINDSHGKFKYGNFKLYLYDVLSPCSHELIYNNIIKSNRSDVKLKISYLSEIGEITSSWNIIGIVEKIKFPNPSWQKSGEVGCITLEINPIHISI